MGRADQDRSRSSWLPGKMSMKTAAARLFSEIVLAIFVFSIGLHVLLKMTPAPDMTRAQARTQVVTSSSGEVLWGFLAEGDKWRLSIKAHDVDQQYLTMLLGYEDKRFREHRGIDVLAVGRAILQAVRHGRAVSGASTLTMQVVRLLEPRPRTIWAKIEQIFKAVKLESLLSKDQILELYLTLAPFGGNIEGVRAASLIYFDKEPKHLSLSEAALLTALPQSPLSRRPDRYPSAAHVARNRVLAALALRRTIDGERSRRAAREPVRTGMHSMTRLGPHFAMRIRSTGTQETLPTLIDVELQRQITTLAVRALEQWSGAVNIAVIVLRNRDASVAAYLGGVDLSADSRKGFVDLVQAIRSPGSALKPFIYALAFEKLTVHPETIITDQAFEADGYRPENADGKFLGDMSVRQALIRSRNTPAVQLLQRMGIDAFLARFHSAGRPLQLPGPDNSAGLAIALGGVGVTLEQLTWYFTALASDGRLNSLRLQPSDPQQPWGQFVSHAAANAVADILADVPAPAGFARQLSADGGRRIGFKTGTSYGFRDAWAVGFDRLHTVGVWVGRADGAAHLGAYGITAAAPILMQIFDRLPVAATDVGAKSSGSLVSVRELPPRLARFHGTSPQASTSPLAISFPRDGSTIRLDRFDGEAAELPLIARGGRPPYQWTLAGEPQTPSNTPLRKWAVDTRGSLEVSIIDADGATAKASFWLD